MKKAIAIPLCMRKSIVLLISRSAIIIFALVGIAICAAYPYMIAITTGLMFRPEASDHSVFYVQLIFYWLTSLPCFVILGIAWKITALINKDEIFSKKTVRLLKLSAVILFCDILVFLIGNLIFLFLEWNGFAIVHITISMVGVVAALFLLVMMYFAENASLLKEETEGII